MYNDQIRETGVSTTSNICHFFVLGTFKHLYYVIQKKKSKMLLNIVAMAYFQTLEFIPLGISPLVFPVPWFS
jgi:hypothetical protein